jgi:hypothetical protein
MGVFVEQVITGKKDLLEELTRYLPGLGYDGDLQYFLNYWLSHDEQVNDDLLNEIKRLKESKRVKLYITTNQEQNRAHYIMSTLGFSNYFEDIFSQLVSGFVNLQKNISTMLQTRSTSRRFRSLFSLTTRPPSSQPRALMDWRVWNIAA